MVNGIVRITVLQQQGDGGVKPSVVYKGRKGPKSKNRNQTRGMTSFEGFVNEAVIAASTAANTYMSRHEQSNRNRQDGWLRDLPSNLWTAVSQAQRGCRFWNT